MMAKMQKDTIEEEEDGHEEPYYSTSNWIRLKDPKMISRILYSNPVCILSTVDDNNKHNSMIISWLSCADNAGGIIASVNKKRFSCQALVRPHATFTLSIPTVGMEDTILKIGGCSGRDVEKNLALNLKTKRVPWAHNFPPAIHHDHVVAVLSCVVIKTDVDSFGDNGHVTLFAKAVHGVVKSSHWKDNKCFTGSPSILSFLGSKRFGGMEEV